MGFETIDFRRFQLENGDLVLDVGCGEGRHTLSAYLLSGTNIRLHAIGLDLGATDLQTAQTRFADMDQQNPRKQVSFVRGSAMTLPFADASVDKVICSEVLEHLPDYQGALQEIKRVLKPGGLLAISVPRFGPEWLCWQLSAAYHQAEGGHIRIFKARQLQRTVEALGMHCYGKHWAHALHSPYWWLRCLLWRNAETSKLVQAYHRFLVWDLMQAPAITRLLETLLNPLIGKSVVMYFVRGAR